MRMHSSKFKDALISRAQPVTIISPIVEETLRSAGIAPDRERILELFMSGILVSQLCMAETTIRQPSA